MASIILSANSLLENPIAGTVIGTLSVMGGKTNETFTYALADNLSDRFEIKLNAATGLHELIVKNADRALFDFDTGNRYFSITITATSTDTTGSGTVLYDTPFTINVIDNVAPTDITLSGTSVLEHSGTGTVVGNLSAFDPNPKDNLTLSLVNDAEGRFAIENGKLIVKDGSKLDFLSKSSHEITIRVTDSDNNTFDKTVTITVGDVLDFRRGTSKSEKIYGGVAGDAIYASGGHDWVYGNGGDDQIDGGSGNDRIYGNDGDDRINGGSGKDILYGGAGKDTFVFTSSLKRGSYDQIRDFNPLEDTIELDLSSLKAFKVKVSFKDVFWSIFTGGNPYKKKYYSLDKVMKEGKLDSKFFSTSYKAKDSNDFIYYNKKNGFVYFDPDGSGREAGYEIAKLQKGLKLTADDFIMA